MNIYFKDGWRPKAIFALVLGILVLASPLLSQSVYQSAKMAYSTREYDKAIALFQQAWRANPGNGNSLFYIGRIYDDQRKVGRAIGWYKKAVKLKMDSDLREQALWKVVLFLERQKNWEELLEYSTLFLRYNNSAKIQQLKHKAEQNYDPVLVSIYKDMHKADQYKNARHYQKALDLYQDILRRRSSYHQARWQAGLMLMKLDNYAKAHQYFKYLIRYDESAWEYYYKSAICLYKTGDYKLALDDLLMAEEKNSDSSKRFEYHFTYLKGLLHYNLNQDEQACQMLHRAIELAGKKATANLLGTAANSHVSCKDYHQASLWSKEALQSEPDQIEALLAQARLDQIHQPSHAWKIGLKLLKKAKDTPKSELHSTWTPFLNWFGIQATKKQDYYTAIAAFEKADLQILTNLARKEREQAKTTDILWDFNYHFGTALMHTKQYDRALLLFSKLGPGAQAYYLSSRVYALQENVVASREFLIKSTNLDASYWDHAQADIAFQALMKKDQEFNLFVQNRNKPVEKPKEEQARQPIPQEKEQEQPQNNSSHTQP